MNNQIESVNSNNRNIIPDNIKDMLIKRGNELIRSTSKDKFIVHNYEKIR